MNADSPRRATSEPEIPLDLSVRAPSRNLCAVGGPLLQAEFPLLVPIPPGPP